LHLKTNDCDDIVRVERRCTFVAGQQAEPGYPISLAQSSLDFAIRIQEIMTSDCGCSRKGLPQQTFTDVVSKRSEVNGFLIGAHGTDVL
jgi:hypothetical protein